MKSESEPMPDDLTIEEACEFWGAHSVADYPSRIVQLQYSPSERLTFVAIADDLIRPIERRAKANGVSVETLINLWVQEMVSGKRKHIRISEQRENG